MFNKKTFADIIRNIKNNYNSQEEFAKVSNISRTYLSLYMNMKMDEIPSRKILKKLANASFGEITYEELLILCDYVDENFEELFYSEVYTHNPYVKNDYILEDVIMDITYMYENLNDIASTTYDKQLITDAYNYALKNKTYSSYIEVYKELTKNLKHEKFYIKTTKEIRNNLADVRMASNNGVDLDGLSEEDIKQVNDFVEFIRNKKKD